MRCWLRRTRRPVLRRVKRKGIETGKQLGALAPGTAAKVCGEPVIFVLAAFIQTILQYRQSSAPFGGTGPCVWNRVAIEKRSLKKRLDITWQDPIWRRQRARDERIIHDCVRKAPIFDVFSRCWRISRTFPHASEWVKALH